MLGLMSRLEVTQHQKQAKFYREDLGGGIDLEMVSIPGGKFRMGALDSEKVASNSERPQHPVTIQSFFISKYQVTQAQWRAVARLSPVKHILADNPAKAVGAEHPVENISWEDAIEFCARLSIKTGRYYQLPTEAQWEYACRAGTSTQFHFGEVLASDLANYQDNDGKGKSVKPLHRGTNPVGSFQWANAFGLYDMHGNVWEWCMDHWHSSYKGAPKSGEAWLKKKGGEFRVIRGGSWLELSANCRSTCRKSVKQTAKENHIGFRIVCSS